MRKSPIAVAVCAVAACAVAAGCFYWWQSAGIVESGKATVEGRMVTAVAAASGTVRDVLVAEGDSVAEGQLLFRLEASGGEQAVARERSRLAAIAAALPPGLLAPSPPQPASGEERKTLAQVREEEEKAREAVEKASDAQAAAAVAVTRLRSLEASGRRVDGTSKRDAQNEHDYARARLAEARKAYELASYERAKLEAAEREALSARGSANAALASRMAEYQAQLSRLDAAERALAATMAAAPEAGRILTVAVRPGFAVEAGDAAVTILADGENSLWVTAFFPENARGRLKTGQECHITLAGGRSIPGVLGTILPPSPGDGPDSGAIAARVYLRPGPGAPLPALGEAATVTVDTRRARP